MEIIISPNPEIASRRAAEVIKEQLLRKRASVLGLATGGTVVGLSPDDPNSYHTFMAENFFSKIDIDRSNTHIPNGRAENIRAYCTQYENKIRQFGGIDLQLLGIGADGHIGFNEPCDHFPVMTHEVTLTEMTREANKRFFDSLEDVPTSAITMGIGTVMSARKILMIVTGADKAEILQQVFFGSVKPEVPGSILQFHPDVTVICDEAAARFVEE